MTDVVVIGAGFAGISAALALQNTGLTVEVIEARDRVGGKVASECDQSGTVVDVGGQWVTDEMTTVLELIRSYGLTLVEPDRPDESLVHPAGSPERISELFEVVASAGGAGSIGDAIRRLPDEHQAGVRSVMQGVWCQDADDVPAAFVAAMSATSVIEGEELRYFVAESIHALSERLAADLDSPVRLGVRAVSVDRNNAGVRVGTSEGTLVARHVVVAIPPQVVSTLLFSPALEPELVAACGSFRAGDVTKVLLRYDAPFWSGAGLMFAEPTGMYVTSMALDSPALVVFMGGPLAAHARTLGAAGRRRFVLRHLAGALGERALEPLSYLERDWPPDDLGSGGYCSVIEVGNPLDTIEVIKIGSSRVTFASTELATSYPGYIEGAIVAGREAAARITSV